MTPSVHVSLRTSSFLCLPPLLTFCDPHCQPFRSPPPPHPPFPIQYTIQSYVPDVRGSSCSTPRGEPPSRCRPELSLSLLVSCLRNCHSVSFVRPPPLVSLKLSTRLVSYTSPVVFPPCGHSIIWIFFLIFSVSIRFYGKKLLCLLLIYLPPSFARRF